MSTRSEKLLAVKNFLVLLLYCFLCRNLDGFEGGEGIGLQSGQVSYCVRFLNKLLNEYSVIYAFCGFYTDSVKGKTQS